MSLFNNIQNALNAKLNGISGIPAIAWPNTEYIPSQGTNFIRPTILPATSVLEGLDGTEMHQGIYQVDIFVQIKKGTAPLWLLADKVRDNFKNVTKLTSGGDVIALTNVSVTQARRDESWWTCSVVINYFCYN